MMAQTARHYRPARQGTPQQAWRRLSNPAYHWLTVPLAAFVVSRFFIFGGAWVAYTLLPHDSLSFLDHWARWDTVWYTGIAADGYWFRADIMSPVAFFPLFPLLMRAVGWLVGSPLLAGLLISNLSFYGALALLYRLTEDEFRSPAVAKRAVFYIASFPTAFFFAAAYSESLFLLLSVAAFYAARQRAWGFAALCGALASATRAPGVILWGVVGFAWLKAHGGALRALHSDYRALLGICLIPTGLLAYMVYLRLAFGDARAFITAQAAWGYTGGGPIAVIARDLQQMQRGTLSYAHLVNIAVFVVVLLATLPVVRRIGPGYALYVAISVLIPMWSRSMSMVRYAVVLFPLFMLLAWWGHSRVLDRLMRYGSLPVLSFLSALFVEDVFIG